MISRLRASWRRRLWIATATCALLIAPTLGPGVARRQALVSLAHAAGATYYVAPDGDDANPCSHDAPCATFLRATDLTAPGDTVRVASGTYGPQVVTANGAATAPIMVTADGPVTLIRPLPLTDAIQGNALLAVLNSSHVTVDGFTAIGAKEQPGYNPADQPYGGEVVAFNHTAGAAGQGLVFSNLTVMHANNNCIKMQDQQPDARVLSSTLVDCGSTYVGYTNAFPAAGGLVHTPNLDHGIYDSGPGLYASNNHIVSAAGVGITTYASDQDDVGRATVVGNVISGTIANAGINLGGAPVTVTNNVVVNAALGGILVYDRDPYHSGAPNLIANNVVIGCGRPFNGSGFMFTDPGHGHPLSAAEDDIRVLNNTFYENASYPIMHSNGIGSVANERLIVENNIIYRPDTNWAVGQFVPYPGTIFDHNDYVGVSARLYEGAAGLDDTMFAHSLMADPLFVDPSAASLPDLRLRGDSPMIGAGADAGRPYTGPAPDLGALPYANAPAAPSATATTGLAPAETASPVPSTTPDASATAPAFPTGTPIPTDTLRAIAPSTRAPTATPPATVTSILAPAATSRSSTTTTPTPTVMPASTVVATVTATSTSTSTATSTSTSTATATATFAPSATAPHAPVYSPVASATGVATAPARSMSTPTSRPISPATETSTPPTMRGTATATVTRAPATATAPRGTPTAARATATGAAVSRVTPTPTAPTLPPPTPTRQAAIPPASTPTRAALATATATAGHRRWRATASPRR